MSVGSVVGDDRRENGCVSYEHDAIKDVLVVVDDAGHGGGSMTAAIIDALNKLQSFHWRVIGRAGRETKGPSGEGP